MRHMCGIFLAIVKVLLYLAFWKWQTGPTLWHFAHFIIIQDKIAGKSGLLYKKQIEVVLDVKKKSVLWNFTQGKSLEGDNIGFYR